MALPPFVAFDVETANPDLSSICEIGLAYFENGECVSRWETLINPDDVFMPVNIDIHGITEDKVRESPRFEDIASEFSGRLSSSVVVTHSKFDLAAIRSVFAKHNLPCPEFKWIDTTRVVRHVWEEFKIRGYGLANVAEKLGIEFQHHRAVEDARASGEILIHAMRRSGLSLEELLCDAFCEASDVQRPQTRAYAKRESVKRDGNPKGGLFGEVIVFTGTLSLSRNEAADVAAAAGCHVEDGVTKRTTLLVVGDQDVRLLNGKDKSSKHVKAEDLIRKGREIRILSESDFDDITYDAIGSENCPDDIIARSISEPIRPPMSIDERFSGFDNGIISAWEKGRQFRANDEKISHQASQGELPELCWAGGLSKEIQARKIGTLHYVAMWQGLRGEDLCINRARIIRLTCTKHRTTVAFAANYVERVKKSGQPVIDQLPDEIS